MAAAKTKKTKTQASELERKYTLYRRLKQYKHLSDADIRQLAQASFDRDVKAAVMVAANDADIDVALKAKFSSIVEQRVAQELLKRYLNDYSLESASEQATVRDIVYLEVVQQRLQSKLNAFDDADVKSVPFDLLDAIHKNADVITKLKTALGLNRSKDKLLGYDAFQHLMKRHRAWRAQNQASRYMKCAHCQRPNLLMMRTDAWVAQRHPFFEDGTIYNKHLFAHLGRTVTIDAKFISDVLGTSPDYINWVLTKIRREPINLGVTNGSTQTSVEG